MRGADSARGIMFVVTDAGGFAAFCARYPQLCVGAGRLDAAVSDDVTTGAPARGEPLATPSDNALVGHFNDQVTTLSPLAPRHDSLKPRLHDTTGCQTDCTTGLTPGCNV